EFVEKDERLLTTGYDRAIHVWNIKTGNKAKSFQGHATLIGELAVSPDGRRFATLGGDADGQLKLWDFKAQSSVRWFGGGDIVDVSSDGTCALNKGDNNAITVMDLATGLHLFEWRKPRKAYVPDFGKMAFRGGPGTVWVDHLYKEQIDVWDVATARQTATLTDLGHFGEFSPDGRLAVTYAKGRADRRLVEIDARRTIFSIPRGEISFSRDGRQLATWDEHGEQIDVRDAGTGAVTRTFATPQSIYGTWTSFSDDFARVAVANGDAGVSVRDTRTGQTLCTLTAVGEAQSTATISPDGRWVFAISAANTLRWFDADTGREIGRHQYRMPVHVPTFAPGGRRVIIRGQGDRVLDFAHQADRRAVRARIPAARAALAANPDDAPALATLGHWHALCAADDFAIPLLEKARAAGADFPPEALARCYWRVGRAAEAKAEFTRAAARAKSPEEKTYFDLCAACVGRC
ncbi:MAG TPA: hypothetical protein VK986_25990, partial [Tepidisphaeraceae bacterium]|nr:hypothetical protein [Tepidisphaeraceae bacterium]